MVLDCLEHAALNAPDLQEFSAKVRSPESMLTVGKLHELGAAVTHELDRLGAGVI
jgi:hypothetical protein